MQVCYGQLTAERDRLSQELSRLHATIEAQLGELDTKEQHLQRLLQQAAELRAVVDGQQQALTAQEQEALRAEEHTRQLLAEQEQLLLTSQARVEALQETLSAIYGSLSWRMVTKFSRLRDRVLPQGSVGRKAYDNMVKAIKG